MRRTGSEPTGSPSRAPRAASLLLAVVALLGGAALLSPPAAGAAGGLLISPSRIEANVRVGDRLPPVRASNGTGTTLVVRAFVLPATQDLSGLPRFSLDRRNTRAGRRLARVAPARLRLDPGAAADVTAVITGRPRRGPGAYGVIVFEARQAGRQRRGRALLTPVVRLTSNLLLRFPGRAVIRGGVRAVRAEQSPKRTLTFFARIRNTGNLHTKPRARLTVASATGRRVVVRRFKPENVLPGAERELPLTVRKVLPAGSYLARVDALVGRRRSSRVLRFRLIGPNELPTPGLRIRSLPVPQPDAGDAFEEDVEVESSGTGEFAPRGVLSLTRSRGGKAIERKQLRYPRLRPGERQELSVDLPALERGEYELSVRFSEAGRVLAERSLVFKTDTRPPLLTRARDWLADHVGAVVIALMLLFGAVVTALLAYIRRLRRRGPA
jgi:hypothetical protein